MDSIPETKPLYGSINFNNNQSLDFSRDREQPSIQNNSNIINEFMKTFMIKQNVKRFSNALLTKIQHLKFVRKAHIKAINDLSSNEKELSVIQQNILDDATMNSIFLQKKQTKIQKKFKKIKRKMTESINRCCNMSLFGSQLKTILSKLFPVIEPEQNIAKILNFLIVIVELFYLIVIPIEIAFNSRLITNELEGINIIFLITIFFNILINCTKTTFQNGQIIRDRFQILYFYFKNNLVKDLISFVSMVVMTDCQYKDLSQYYNFFGLAFFMQIGYLLERREEQQEKQGASKTLRHIYKFLSLIFQILYAEHFFACFFFLISSSLSTNPDIPTFHNKYLIDLSWQGKYIETMYFSATTMITVGYGDLSPVHSLEKFFAIIFMLLSCIQLSYSVSLIGSIIEEIKIDQEENKKKLRLITAYMEEKNISNLLQRNVREYLNYFWEEEELESQQQQQQDLISQLPQNLKKKLLKEVNSQVIQNCPLFKKFDFSQKFKDKLSQIIVTINMQPEETIEESCKNLDIQYKCIYYIEKGEIQMLAKRGRNSIKINQYNQKDYFGFEDFFNEDEIKHQYQSTKFTRLLAIPRNTFVKYLRAEDKETYLMIKDDLQMKSQPIFRTFCIGCTYPFHSLSSCPYTHFIADKEKLIKYDCYFHKQKRQQWERKSDLRENKLNALNDKDFINECTQVFQIEQENQLKNIYDYQQTESSESEVEQPKKIEQKVDSSSRQQDKKKLIQNIFIKQKINKSNKETQQQEKKDNEIQIINEENEEQNQEEGTYFLSNLKNNFEMVDESEDSQRNENIEDNFQKEQDQLLIPKSLNPILPSMNNLNKRNSSRRFSSRLAIYNITKNNFADKFTELQKSIQDDVDESKGYRNQQQNKNNVFSNQKLMYNHVYRVKSQYENHMNDFIKKDLHKLEMLWIKLKSQIFSQIIEDFECAELFSGYKPSENYNIIINECNNTKKMEPKQIVKFRKYLFYPQEFIRNYRKASLTKNTLNVSIIPESPQKVEKKTKAKKNIARKSFKSAKTIKKKQIDYQRYFINNLDTPIGQEFYDALVKEDTEEGVHMATYVQNERLDVPKGFKKILKRAKPKLARKKMLEECDVYIYDLHYCDKSDIDYVYSIFSNPALTLDDQKVLVVISNVMTWSDTPKKVKPIVEEKKEDEENEEKNEDDEQKEQDEQENQEEQKEEEQNNEDDPDQPKSEKAQEEQKEEDQLPPPEPVYVPYDEADYQSRVPKEKYQEMKDMEDLVLKLQKENLKVIVVCSGIWYGNGENTFYNHFKSAWLQNPQALPYLGEGDNKVPTIHINDLIKLVIKVSEAPCEQNYVFGIDNTPDRSQKALVQAISNLLGSRQVQSVEHTDLIENEDIFRLNIDMNPSNLIVGNEENPADFEWTCEKGIGNQKVLDQFWKIHKLRPMKLLMTFLGDRNQLRFDETMKEISQHYRIPIITLQDILESGKSLLEGELLEDYIKELPLIEEYVQNGVPKAIDEPLKLFYQVVKIRLNENDCINRGYILDSFPHHFEECEIIFYPNLKKLKRKRKPKKKQKKQKVEDEEQQEQGQEEQEGQQNKDDEGGENEGDGEGQGEEQQGEQEEEKKEEEYAEEEEQQEEEQPEEEQEEEVEEGEEGPKKEKFYPESFILIKELERSKTKSTFKNKVVDYFTQQKMEIQMLDTRKRNKYQVFESLRMYIERNGRPYNYLQDEKELVECHFEFYEKQNEDIQKQQAVKKVEVEQVKKQKYDQRVDVEQSQIKYVLENEKELEQVQNFPFRNYLMEYVVPVLNEGLVEVSHILPDDPVEFLAELLYKRSFEVDNEEG